MTSALSLSRVCLSRYSQVDCDWLSRFALPAEKNDPADPDREIDTNCGTDLVSSSIGGEGMVSVVKRQR